EPPELHGGREAGLRSGVEELLQPGESADVSFASGALSYLECTPPEVRSSTPSLSSSSVASSAPSKKSTSSVGVACVAKRVEQGSITESLLQSACECTSEFVSLRRADWEAVEKHNLGSDKKRPVDHAVPTGMGRPSKFHNDYEYWAMACILGAGNVCLASVWCSDGSRIVAEIGPDTVGNTKLMVGEKALLLQGVQGVFNSCTATSICQKSRFAGQSSGQRTREGTMGRLKKNEFKEKQPAKDAAVDKALYDDLGILQESDRDDPDADWIGKVYNEPAQMEKVPLWYLECSNEYLESVHDIAAVYTFDRNSYVKMGWANDRAATVYCRTSSSRPHGLVLFPFPLASLWAFLILLAAYDAVQPS
ncbi:hypothetical protein CSUI_004304, partial [Cystoisospora suis]